MSEIRRIQEVLNEVVEIPRIEINNVPKEVSNIAFISSLVNSNNMELNIDELVNHFTKDN